MNPRIDIHFNKLKHNTKIVSDKCKVKGIKIAAVTKAFCGIPEIAKAYVDGGAKYLADSRIENLKKLSNLPVEKIMLRLPMLSQVDETVKYADISLNSEIETIIALNDASKKLGKEHKIIIMVDLGDLREGFFDNEELESALLKLKDLKNIKVIGIGSNLTCYGGVIPDETNLGKLVEYGETIERVLDTTLEIISGGNSSSIYLLEEDRVPKRINNLRLGESLLLGRESSYGDSIPNTYKDVFQVVAEIIEIKEKPSHPIGEIGRDAFWNIPVFEDKGIRKRAILAIGRQDIGGNSIEPLDDKIEVIGASSDHLIIDITECNVNYKVGDEISFNIAYGALLSLMTSEYVHKNIIY